MNDLYLFTSIAIGPYPQSILCHISLTFTLILYSYLCIHFPNGLFPWCFVWTLCDFAFPPHVTQSAHLILLDIIVLTILGEVYRLWRLLLYNFLYAYVAYSLLGPNALPNLHLEWKIMFCFHINQQIKWMRRNAR